MRRLEVTAKYTPDSDRVDILVWFYDPDNDVAHPEEITEGLARVLSGNNLTTTSWEFDKYNGNGQDFDGSGSGSIRLFWNKPNFINNMFILVEINDVNDDDYSITVPVVGTVDDSYIPQTENPDTEQLHEYRSRRRLEERVGETDLTEDYRRG